jgi:hypothetical protein
MFPLRSLALCIGLREEGERKERERERKKGNVMGTE